MTEELKICKKCLIEKSLDRFSINWKYIKNICKDCSNKYSKNHYNDNKEEYNISHKEYYYSNKDKVLTKQKITYYKNRDIKLKKCKEYKSSEVWKMNSKISSHKRRIIINWYWNDWTVTLDNINNKLIEQNFNCAYCWCDLKLIQKHLDHIHPLSKWWTHSIDNVQWTCATCNLKKNTKTHNEFLIIIKWQK